MFYIVMRIKKEMKIIGENSPLVSKFIIKKTSQFYGILS